MPAWEHPDWTNLLAAWQSAESGSEEKRMACLALADASEEMGDSWSAFTWRHAMVCPAQAEVDVT